MRLSLNIDKLIRFSEIRSGDPHFPLTPSLNRSNGVNAAYGYETDSDLSQLNHLWASGAGQTPATFGFQHDGAGRITLTQVSRPDLEWMPTLAEAASYGVPTSLNQTTSVNGVGLVWDHKGNLDQHGTTYPWICGSWLWPGGQDRFPYGPRLEDPTGQLNLSAG